MFFVQLRMALQRLMLHARSDLAQLRDGFAFELVVGVSHSLSPGRFSPILQQLRKISANLARFSLRALTGAVLRKLLLLSLKVAEWQSKEEGAAIQTLRLGNSYGLLVGLALRQLKD